MLNIFVMRDNVFKGCGGKNRRLKHILTLLKRMLDILC